MTIIERRESEVRSYCRSFPAIFDRAEGAYLYDTSGRAYLDFFAGAGALNYGHNHPVLREALLSYLQHGGVVHSLDMTTEAKLRFLKSLEKNVLVPRGMPHKVLFPGPTGTNAVEAALKVARRYTGRRQIVSFTNGFHGMTLGSLSATGNHRKRVAAGVPLDHVVRAPFDGYHGPAMDTLKQLRTLLADRSSGVDAPAAFLVETVQAEGGINVASREWLRGLAQLAKETGALLIVDDIQVGCGRTGAFFSFEEAGIEPDIVCLSKALSGFGLPLAVVLLRPEVDVLAPGEHNGTFRGHNLAFVTATAALEHFWRDRSFTSELEVKSTLTRARLEGIAQRHGGRVRGRGLILGLSFEDRTVAKASAHGAFERGLLVETAGAENQVLKLLPPLTATLEELNQGLDVLEESVALARKGQRGARRSSSRAPFGAFAEA